MYISNPLSWEAPPKDPELPQHEWTSASLVIFYRSGDFAEGLFGIGRHGKNGSIFIIPGEGFDIAKGKWIRNPDGSITVKSQVVFAEGVPKQPVPGPVREGRWTVRGKASNRLGAVLESPFGQYIPLRRLENLKTFDDILHERVVPAAAIP